NASPPTIAPGAPRSRHAQKIASCVEAGPGRRLQAAIASSNSTGAIHRRRSTHSARSSAMCDGGPPKPMHPIRPHSARTTRSEGAGLGSCTARFSLSAPGNLRAMGEEQRLPPGEQLAAAREAFESGTDFTVAVEEEFALVDPHTLGLVNRFED